MTLEPSITLCILVLSELAALWVIWRLWRSGDHPFFKVVLSLLALLPVLGPIIALWIGNFPPRAPRVLQDQRRYRTDLYDRWRSTFEAPSPRKRFYRWRELMTKHRNEDP